MEKVSDGCGHRSASRLAIIKSGKCEVQLCIVSNNIHTPSEEMASTSVPSYPQEEATRTRKLMFQADDNARFDWYLRSTDFCIRTMPTTEVYPTIGDKALSHKCRRERRSEKEQR
jgi:hypothetical protein